MAFYEVQFPTDIGLDALGGPERAVDVVTLDSGFEERNSAWTASRRRYDISYGIKRPDDLATVLGFWESVGGNLHGFRFKDPTDFKSCAPQQTVADTDQTLGTGDAAETDFQLVKAYASGAGSYSRTIAKPVSGTVVVSLDDVSQASGWSVDTTTGIVTFTTPPGAGVVVKAGFQFDVPARFDIRHFAQRALHDNAGLYDAIPIVEVRL